MFIGRKKQLERLNKMYKSNKFEFAVIYGRRRVGKTTLIKEFCKDKNAIYYTAREADGNINLRSFSEDFFRVVDENKSEKVNLNNWETAFDMVAEYSQKDRLVLVIDEYPYLASGYKSISSILQNAIDHKFLPGKLFLILCGSSMSFMENQVLGYQSPLYGRRTAQFKIRPFDYFESRLFFDGFEDTDKALLYGITGGIPEYMSKINSKISVKENIIDLYLTDSGHFFEEPTNLMKQELREPAIYNGIIESVACGSSKLNEIANAVRLESNVCSKYTASLISLGILKKEIPVTEVRSKKSIYLLEDQMFRFWYRFVFPNMSLIIADKGELVYESKIKSQLSNYMGQVFEEICLSYFFIDEIINNAPFLYNNIGRWWGGNPKTKRQEEIDLMGYDESDALFAECKWTNAMVDMDVLNTLKMRSDLFEYENKYYWIFSKSGFTDNVKNAASEDVRINLVDFETLSSVGN